MGTERDWKAWIEKMSKTKTETDYYHYAPRVEQAAETAYQLEIDTGKLTRLTLDKLHQDQYEELTGKLEFIREEIREITASLDEVEKQLQETVGNKSGE